MTVFTETWTGTNGAAWSGSWTAAAPAGASNQIQSNAGRQVTGTTVSQGPSEYYNVNTAITDFDLTVTGNLLTAATTYSIISFRADAMVANRGVPNNGYGLIFNAGAAFQIAFYAFTGGTASPILGYPTDLYGDPGGKMRLRVVGSFFRAKFWRVTAAEPAWQVEINDATYTSGRIALGAEESALSSSGFAWDDLSLTVPPVDDWAGLPRSTRDNYRGVR